MNDIVLAWYAWLSGLTQGLVVGLQEIGDRVPVPAAAVLIVGLIGAASPCRRRRAPRGGPSRHAALLGAVNAMRRRHRALIVSAAVVGGVAMVLAGLLLIARRDPSSAASTDLERLGNYGEVPFFELTERSDRRVTRDDLRGSVWVLDFIYTECTETCPTQSLAFAQLQREFAPDSSFRLVSITVDPAHDTPAVLRTYAERYAAAGRWWLLTGDRRAIYCLARNGFRLAVTDPRSPDALDCGVTSWFGPGAAWASHGSQGLVIHSARFVLVDRKGQIRAYHLATDPDSLARLRANIRRLLRAHPQEERG